MGAGEANDPLVRPEDLGLEGPGAEPAAPPDPLDARAHAAGPRHLPAPAWSPLDRRIQRAERLGTAMERLVEALVPWTMSRRLFATLATALILMALAPLLLGWRWALLPALAALALLAARFLGRALAQSRIGPPRCARCGYERPNFDPPPLCPECAANWRAHGGTTCEERVTSRADVVVGLIAIAAMAALLLARVR